MINRKLALRSGTSMQRRVWGMLLVHPRGSISLARPNHMQDRNGSGGKGGGQIVHTAEAA